MEPLKRLYLLTGKGGVGKTSFAISLCYYLQKKGKNPFYLSFNSGSLDEKQKTESNSYIIKSLDQLDLDYQFLNLEDTLRDYVSDKLNSTTIGYWIVKTPFFRSLINIIPGLNYLIYVGKTIHYLESNPSKVAVIDGPATGHCLTLLNSIYRFKNIFKSGVLHDDCQKMASFLENEKLFKIILLSLPQSLVLSETEDYKKQIENLYPFPLTQVINQSITKTGVSFQSQLLSNYSIREKEALADNQHSIELSLPFFVEKNLSLLAQKIASENMEKVL